MAAKELFDVDRQQWFSNPGRELIPGWTPYIWKVGSGEEWGPTQPGSRYTDYFYVPKEGAFVALEWDPSGKERRVTVPSSELTSGGLPFTSLEWTRVNGARGHMYHCQQRNGRWRAFGIWPRDWPQQKSNQTVSSTSSSYGDRSAKTYQAYPKNEQGNGGNSPQSRGTGNIDTTYGFPEAV